MDLKKQKEHFKNHVATFTDYGNIKILDFKAPGRSDYRSGKTVYGCHLEKSPNRFERMKETHPAQYDYIMKPWEEGGLGYKDIIDWINENGNMNIKY